MAIGRVAASGGLANSLVSDRSSGIVAGAAADLSGAVEGLARAGMGYLQSQTEVDRIYDRRAQASVETALDTQFIQYQEARAQEFADFSRENSANPVGMTKRYSDMVAEREKEFLATVPERQKEEYTAKLQRDRAQRAGSAFRAELELMDDADSKNLTVGLNTLGSSLKGGTISLEDASATWEENVNKSGLAESTKRDMILNGKQTLEGLAFGTEVERAVSGYGAANSDWSGSDVVAAGLLPLQRGVLNAISSVEAKSYNIWNGGATFEGYADHPAALGQKAPGASTAAGRYQFILGTWKAASSSYEKTYGVKVADFSPEWQDRVALHWAEVQFNKWNNEGLNFRQVLESGDPAQLVKIRRVLGNPKFAGDPNSVEWQGLGDAYMGGQAAGDEKFLQVLTGQSGLAGGGTGAASAPNVWTDPRFANIGIADKLRFANSAQEQVERSKRESASALAAEVKRFNESVFALGYSTGDLNQMEGLRNSPLWSAEAEKQFRQGVTDYRNKETATSDISRKLDAGEMLTSRDQSGYATWFGDENFTGLSNGDQAAYAKLRYGVQQSRLLPEGSVDAFRAAQSSPDTAQMAMDFLASLHEGDPTILARSGFSDKDIADAMVYKRLAGRASPDKAYEQYQAMQENIRTLGLSPDKARKEAQTYWTDNFSDVSDVVGIVDQAGWFANSNVTLNPGLTNSLNLDAMSAFQDGYLATGSLEGAEEYMKAHLQKTWGTSYTKAAPDFSERTLGIEPGLRPVLMRNPPENSYPRADGEYEYLYREIERYVGLVAPEGVTLRPGSYTLASDKETDQQVRNGEAPTYKVMATGEMGEVVMLPGRWGGDYLNTIADNMNNAAADRKQSLAAIDGFNDLYEVESNRVREARNKAVTPEELALVAEAEAGLAELKGRRDGAAEAAAERGFLAQIGHDIIEPYANMTWDSFFGSVNLSDEAKVVQRTKELLSYNSDTVEFHRRLNSRATDIIKTERDTNGKRFNMPRATAMALEEILVKELQITPEMAAKIRQRYEKGSL